MKETALDVDELSFLPNEQHPVKIPLRLFILLKKGELEISSLSKLNAAIEAAKAGEFG